MTKDTERKTLVDLIVGRKLSDQYPKHEITKGKVILEVKNLTYLDKIRDVSFTLREGEIVAFFGLIGSGVHKLFPLIFGVKRYTSGEIYIEGSKVNIRHPDIAIEKLVGYVPLDRKEEGVAVSLSVQQNITAANIQEIGGGFLLDEKIETEHADRWFKKLNIKAPGLNTVVNSLSGGNQQKVVVAKWLERNSKILLMNEPTRGIDIGSKAEIYSIVEDICKQGAGVLIVSTELPEIMAISDRVFVMRDGRIAGEFNTKKTSQEELMHIASA